MTLKDKMKTLSTEANKIKNETEQEKREKATDIAKKNGIIGGNRIVKELPARIKTAAKKGDTSISEWCYSGSETGGYTLGTICRWAETEGFKTKFDRNCEGANEGQDDMDYLTISWE